MADEYLNALMEAMQAPTKQYEEEDPYLIANAGLSRVDYSGIEDPLQKALAGVAKGFTMGATRRLGQDNVRSKEKEYESKLLEALNNRGQEIDDPLISRRINQIDIADRARQRAIDEDLRKRQLEADIDVQKVQNMERGKENVKVDLYNQSKTDPDHPETIKVVDEQIKQIENTPVFRTFTDSVDSNYRTLTDAFANLELADSGKKEFNPQMQLSMIVSIAKLEDPGSVAKEGEVIRVQQSGQATLSDKVLEAISIMNEGRKLSPEARKALMDKGRSLYASRRDSLMNYLEGTKEVFKSRGIPTRDFESKLYNRFPDANTVLEQTRAKVRGKDEGEGTYYGLSNYDAKTGEVKQSSPKVEAPQQSGGNTAEEPTQAQQRSFNDTFNALLKAESSKGQFDEQGNVIKSTAGALGASQLMPDTARMLEKQYGFPEGSSDADETINKTLGALYFNQMKNKYKDDTYALAAYNWGPGNVDALIKATGGDSKEIFRRLPKETQEYIFRIKQGGAIRR